MRLYPAVHGSRSGSSRNGQGRDVRGFREARSVARLDLASQWRSLTVVGPYHVLFHDARVVQKAAERVASTSPTFETTQGLLRYPTVLIETGQRQVLIDVATWTKAGELRNALHERLKSRQA